MRSLWALSSSGRAKPPDPGLTASDQTRIMKLVLPLLWPKREKELKTRIIIALALFLFGIASLVRQQRIKVGLGAVGGVILVFSVIRLLQLGNPAGVTFGLLF